MKTSNGLILTIAAVVSLCLVSTSAWAGSAQQHRWEGVAIGIGAAIVGSAIIHHHGHSHHATAPVRYGHGHRKHYQNSHRYHGYKKPRYRGHHRNGKSHFRGPGYDRKHHARERHAYNHGYRKHSRHGKSHDRYDSSHRGNHGGRSKHGRGNRGH